MTDATRTQAQLNALSEAALAVSGELGLDRVLNRLAKIAADLVNARYAALGVPDGKGGLAQFLVHGMNSGQIARMDHYPLGLGLLGELLKEPYPIRLDNLKEDPRSAGFCQNHPVMTTFLGVPIISKGKHLGNLYLCDRLDGQPFSEEDERMITLLAAHAGIAIENAQLSEQLQTLAVIEERDRISMELHDGIIQSIYAVGIKLELARQKLDASSPVSADITSANLDLDRVIEDLRNYIRNLQVGLNFSLALREQLEDIANGFRQVSTAHLAINIGRAFTQLNEERLHTLVQIAREALSNVVRHANASEVTVDLFETGEQITLVITDNGKGFEAGQPTNGNGLKNIRHRADLVGGNVELISQPGRGMTLTVAIPT